MGEADGAREVGEAVKLWLITYTDCGSLKTAALRGNIWDVTEACNRNSIPVCNIIKVEQISSEQTRTIS